MKAAVLGLGVIGPGIAATLARGGIDVACYDINEARVRAVKGDMPSLFEALVRLGANAIIPKQGELRFESEIGAAVRDVDLVIEALPERVEIKHTMLAALDRIAPATAILASTTAGIPITRLQEAVGGKGRVVGMHWSNPSHLASIVEIIAGAHTDPATVATARAIVANIGVQPVVVARDVAGSVHTRLSDALEREAAALVADGVITRAELEKCLRWGLGLKLAAAGPEVQLAAIRKTMEGR